MSRGRCAWMVRAGNDNELADLVEEERLVAIGWRMGDVSGLKTGEQFKQRYREVSPEALLPER